jgi:hypothetical protein
MAKGTATAIQISAGERVSINQNDGKTSAPIRIDPAPKRRRLP